MARLMLTDEAIEVYFGYFLRNLDAASKRRIISKFAASLEAPPPEPTDFFEYMERVGPWEDVRSAEEITQDIREARVAYGRSGIQDQ